MNDAEGAHRRPLTVVELETAASVAGPILFFDRAHGVHFDEVVEVETADGDVRRGRVLEVDGDRAAVEVFSGTHGLGLAGTRLRLGGDSARLGVGWGLLGRIFDGAGEPIDGAAPVFPERFWDVNGHPLNPAARTVPADLIETGVSAIDGFNSLVRGQKLPIFSGFGLPGNELVARIAAQARVPGDTDDAGFAVVFAALGITRREAAFFRRFFEESGRLGQTVLFLNLADDPAIERLLTPRLALSAAEYLAFDRGQHVLAILTDMTSYCEALREVATAREEVPGRRGFPGYMYTDLAQLYERAGRLEGRPGSLTQLVHLSMPDDDITHPIPDLTGYITEGQIVLSRELHRKGIDPPIDVLPSLSRLMNAGIGDGRTREDHRPIIDQLYAFYAEGRSLRQLVAIVGEASLGPDDERLLAFADAFEKRLVGQGGTRRTVLETLNLAWELVGDFPAARLGRIRPELLARYHGQNAGGADGIG